MSDGTVRYAVADGVATIVFDRPHARNALTWAMYDKLAEACTAIAGDAGVRVTVLRGAGGAFVAGTDIGQFTAFASAEDGVAYERHMDEIVATLEALRMPTVAVIEGPAMGAGLVIAAVSDIRIATTGAKLGVPIARTVGNCLSIANIARLAATLGAERTRRVLLLAELVSAEEALACGFLHQVVAADGVEAAVTSVCARLLSHAPITMEVSKEALRRLRAAGLPGADDLVRRTYGSDDFKDGVKAFLNKQPARWHGK